MKNILKIFVLLFIFVSADSLNAQDDFEFEAPDYALIQKNIKDKNSEFYYPEMMKKLKARDTLLTHDQYTHLYYGYFFQDEYSAWGVKTTSEKAELDEAMDKEFEEIDHDEIIRITDKILDKFPFDLETMYLQALVYAFKGDEDTGLKILANYEGLVFAILSSGDGMDCETGLHVLTVDHEYFILELMGLEPEGQSLINEEDSVCDLLHLKENDFGLEDFYFNVSQIFEGYEKTFGSD